MGVLGKCCIVKQNEFSILERMAKMKELLEKQRVSVRKQLLRVEEGQKQKAEVERICELQLLAEEK